MGRTTRRNFIKSAGMGVAAMSLSPMIKASDKNAGNNDPSAVKFEEKLSRLNLGMASYTFREFSLAETLQMTKRLGLERVAFKSFHLPLESSDEEIKAAAEKTRAAGLDLYGCGVVYMEDEEEVKRAFHYAKTAGMSIIIGVPNPDLLKMVSKMVNKYNIKVAIHNHGPDPRIGLCIDIGHTQRAGIDPSESALKFADRLHDVHIKDVTAATKQGGTIEIGHGVIDIPKFLRTLIKLNYKASVSFEFEKDGKDPLPGVAESVGYVRGVLASI